MSENPPGTESIVDHRCGKAVQAELRPLGRALRREIPDVYAAYKQLHEAVTAPGALEPKVKELIAVAVAVSEQCDGCIASHTQAAVSRGATPAEMAEAIGVTFLLCGGPATVYGARAFAAFMEYREAQ
ncbi:carboxymuconolactone decarboxylase family protein [Kitasatospora sp. NPDC059571]|uniref:carboxymuconolactone decarboxylase family protein n=1 Tax=Kitasatospora sp. NPDC059571 TaxID=3346871 RepID=UPI0036821B7E